MEKMSPALPLNPTMYIVPHLLRTLLAHKTLTVPTPLIRGKTRCFFKVQNKIKILQYIYSNNSANMFPHHMTNNIALYIPEQTNMVKLITECHDCYRSVN